MVVGFAVYLFGGWLFAAAYWAAFEVLGASGWWVGSLLGFAHALFLLIVVLPVMPHLHPRMASEYMGPAAAHGIEPPGFLCLNYGLATPLVTIAAHTIYGAILGLLLPAQ